VVIDPVTTLASRNFPVRPGAPAIPLIGSGRGEEAG